MWYQRNAKNKYRSVSTIYEGRQYHSKAEAAYAAELDLRKKAKQILSWEPQVKVSLDVNGYHISNYYVDFLVNYSDGTIEYVEVKGFETEVYRLKKKLFEATFIHEHPGTKYSVIKV